MREKEKGAGFCWRAAKEGRGPGAGADTVFNFRCKSFFFMRCNLPENGPKRINKNRRESAQAALHTPLSAAVRGIAGGGQQGNMKKVKRGGG